MSSNTRMHLSLGGYIEELIRWQNDNGKRVYLLPEKVKEG